MITTAQSNESEPDRRHGDRHNRILVVVRHPVGGVRTHILYTYPILMRAGYRFTFVVPDDESHTTFCAEVEAWDGVEVVRVPYRDAHHQKPLFRAAVRRLLAEKRFLLIHSHGVQAAIPTFIANLGFGLPHVMTSQDVFCRVGLAGMLDQIKLWSLAQLLRRLDVLIAVSEDTKRDHLRYLPGLAEGPCQVSVIPNGIDIKQYSNGHQHESCGLRQQLAIDDKVCLIGFLGRFMPQKGFLILADALTRLARTPGHRPWHLLAVGSGDYFREYRAHIDSTPELAGRVSFLEHVSNVAPILNELDLLVMPSLWEACPLLPMEALICGIPVIGTDCIGLREVLHDSPSILVPANDPQALARAIAGAVEAADKTAFVDYMPIARKRFDVEPIGQQLRDLFDELTST